MAFGPNNDMDIQVKVDASGAIRVLDSLGNEIKKVEGAAKGAETGFSGFQKSIITLNQALGLAKAAFTGLGKAMDGLKRGADVQDVADSFDKLTKKAGGTVDVFLNDLSKATKDTVSNFDLMRRANEQLRAGLKPDEILTLTKVAKQFADQDGKDFASTLDQITRSMVTSTDRFLKQKGVVIDNAKALKDFADKHGGLAKNLTEVGKAAALQQANLEAMRKKLKETGDNSKDAGDKVSGMGAKFQNAIDKELQQIAANAEVNEFLRKTQIAVDDYVIPALTRLSEALIGGLKFLNNFGTGLEVLNEILKGRSTANAIDIVALRMTEAALAANKATKATTGFIDPLRGIPMKGEEAGKALEDVEENFFDTGEAAEEAAEKLKALREEFAKMQSEGAQAADKDLFKFALEELDFAALDKISARMTDTFAKSLDEGIKKFIGTDMEQGARDMAEVLKKNFRISLNQEQIERNQKEIDALKDRANEAREELMAAYEDAVNFYGQIWSEIIHTGTFDLANALKEVAVGFAAQMTAAMLGIPGFSSFGGLGQGLAGSLLGGSGGGLGGIASLAGGAGLLSGTSAGGFISGIGGNVGPVASGAEYSGMLAGAGPAGWAALATAAVLAVGSQTKWFGLEGGMSAGQKERAGIRDSIVGMAGGRTDFNGQNLFGIDFKQFDDSIPILKEAREELEGLALVLTKGGEQADEFAKIFAILVTGFEDGAVKTDDLNIAMQEAGQFMNQLGLTTEDAKGQLLQLFKQGQITSAQFASGLESLNQVAAANLLSIQDYFYQTFGPEAAQLLESLRVAGINTWQDIAGASVDQIAVMIGELNKLGVSAEQALSVLAQADVVQANAPEAPTPSSSYGSSSSRSTTTPKKTKKKTGIAGDILGAISASKDYQNVLTSLNAALITESQATSLLNSLYDQGKDLLKEQEKALKNYNRAIRKGSDDTGKFAKELASINKQIQELGGGEGSNAQQFNQGLLDFVKEFGDNLAAVNLAAIAAGSSFAAMKNEAVKAFLAGKTTAADAQKQLLGIGPGDPNSFGNVGGQLSQLSSLGLQGGALSLNALRGLGSESIEAGGKTFDDLINRGLSQGGDRGQLQAVMIALQNAGVTTLEQIRDLSDESGIAILSNLQDIGFVFGQTSSGITKLLEDLAAIPDSKDIDVRLNISAGDISPALQRIFDLFGIEFNTVMPGYGSGNDKRGKGGKKGGKKNKAGGHLSA